MVNTEPAGTLEAPVEVAIPDYPLWVRLSHAINAVALIALIGSGLEIFNAHPTLYLSDASDPRTAILTLPEFPGFLTLGGWLAGARRLHLAAAPIFILNGLAYLAYMAASRRRKAIWPQASDWRGVGSALRDHLRLPPILAGEGGGLNPLQKISYLGVSALLVPFVILTGLALSPQWDAIFPWYADLFLGRQFARTFHFLATAGFVGFLAIHVLLVLLAGKDTLLHIIAGGKHDA